MLQSEIPLAPHVLVLDEFNLATVDNYLSLVLSAMESGDRTVQLPGGEIGTLPVDCFVVATCNSYLDEPESRLPLSGATKRRAAIIPVPNHVATLFTADGSDAVINFGLRLVANELKTVRERVDRGLGSTFDILRLREFAKFEGPPGLSAEARERLAVVLEAWLGTPNGMYALTPGVLRDIFLALAAAPPDPESELAALGHAIEDKIVPQLRGPEDAGGR